MTLAIVWPKEAFAIKDNDYSFKTPNIHVFLLGKVKIYSYQTYTNIDYPYIKPSNIDICILKYLLYNVKTLLNTKSTTYVYLNIKNLQMQRVMLIISLSWHGKIAHKEGNVLQATYHALSNLLYYPFHYNVHSKIPLAFVIEFLLGKISVTSKNSHKSRKQEIIWKRTSVTRKIIYCNNLCVNNYLQYDGSR